MKINFDLFYELNHGSVISNTYQNVKQFWRKQGDNLEIKMYVNEELTLDWQTTDSLHLPFNGVFKIEERFPRHNASL